jgi:hypothetical protein
MTRNMRTVSAKAGTVIHVETPNGIVNVYCGLHDRLGRDVDTVEVIPDNYPGERPVRISGGRYARLIRLKHPRRANA